MIKYLPERWSKHWLLVGVIYLIIVWVMLLVARHNVPIGHLNMVLSLRFLFLSAIISFIINGMGWLGFRLAWICSTLGLALGFIMMYVNSAPHSGWEDLINFFTFISLLAIGLGSGIVLELIVALYRYLKR